MSHKLGILFLHHGTDRVVRRNLSSIRAQNPEATVVTMSAGKPFKGGYTLDKTPDIRQLHSMAPARSSDWLVCSWYLQRQEDCDKWWIVEWDTFTRISVWAYYHSLWEQPFISSSV